MAGGKTIYVAGAGIAGLTLTLALAKFGANVVVLERAPSIQEAGAGLQLSPNARKVLNRLGLDKAIAGQSFAPEGIDVYAFRSHAPQATLALGEAASRRFGAPYAVMHRADLADALYRACRRFANVDMLFGVRGFDAEPHARGVSITVEEADGRSRSGRAFALVGADGVNSHTRTGLIGEAAARYSGHVAWRATLPIDALTGVVANDRTSLMMGPGYHAVIYPLPHRRLVNVVLLAREKRQPMQDDAPKGPKLPWAMLKSQRFEAVMQAAGDSWGFWPLLTVSAKRWHAGGIGLIGDAAHAMLPFQAQGAAMAIEDAAVLAPLLMTEPDADGAFSRFAAARRGRVRRVAQVSSSNGRIFHMQWPFTMGRDTVIRLGGSTAQLRRLAWIYGYDAAPEIEGRGG
jgi:salicylate hydroxylase